MAGSDDNILSDYRRLFERYYGVYGLYVQERTYKHFNGDKRSCLEKYMRTAGNEVMKIILLSGQKWGDMNATGRRKTEGKSRQ